jgi:hypothetical protein
MNKPKASIALAIALSLPAGLYVAASGPALAAKPAKGAPKRDRVGDAKKLLSQAAAASKKPDVKAGIQQALGMVEKQQFAQAKTKVEALVRSAALAGDAPDAVLKMNSAADALNDAANRAKKGRKP